MMKNLTLLLLLILCAFISNAQDSKHNSLEYIKDYYSNFNTGYDYDGKYIPISGNYEAVFSDSIFTLSFDSFDKQNNIKKQNITINLKEVISIEPNGTDVVEILDNEPLILPICGKLAFNTKNESYEINIYYEADDDVEQTQIYKTFKTLIENHKISKL